MAYRMGAQLGCGLLLTAEAWSGASTLAPISGNAWTVFARFKIATAYGHLSNERIFFVASNGTTVDFIQMYARPNEAFQLFDTQSSVDAGSTTVVDGISSWAVTANHGTNTSVAYQDGASIATNQAPSFATVNALGINRWAERGSQTGNWNAEVSDVRLWSTDLTSGEIATEHASLVPVKTANLAAWWPLRYDFADYSGNAKAGLIGLSGTFTEINPLSWSAAS